MKKFRRNRTTNYIQQFEKDLASLDYTESPEVLFEQIRGYFKDNVHTDDVDFLIESGDEGLVTLYSSDNKQIKIPSNFFIETPLYYLLLIIILNLSTYEKSSAVP